MRRGCPSDYHCAWARGLAGPGASRQSSSSHWHSTSSTASPTGYHLCWHSLGWALICWIYCWPHAESVTALPAALGDLHYKWTYVKSQEVKVRCEHSSVQGKEDMSALALEARPSSKTQGQEPTSPTKTTANPDDGTVVGTLRSTRDQGNDSSTNHSGTSSDLDASRENVANSHMESAAKDCFTCSDTDEVTIRTGHKKYRRRVWASYSLDKGSLWSDAQLKKISDSHKAMWGHVQEIIRMEQDCTLQEDHNSFKMHKMTVRTDQLLHIAEATNLKVYTWESEAEAHGWKKALVLSLKQYHTNYYQLYKKGISRAMVGLQGLHLGDTFRHSNVSSSVGLKSFCHWCFKLGGTPRW